MAGPHLWRSTWQWKWSGWAGPNPPGPAGGIHLQVRLDCTGAAAFAAGRARLLTEWLLRLLVTGSFKFLNGDSVAASLCDSAGLLVVGSSDHQIVESEPESEAESRWPAGQCWAARRAAERDRAGLGRGWSRLGASESDSNQRAGCSRRPGSGWRYALWRRTVLADSPADSETLSGWLARQKASRQPGPDRQSCLWLIDSLIYRRTLRFAAALSSSSYHWRLGLFGTVQEQRANLDQTSLLASESPTSSWTSCVWQCVMARVAAWVNVHILKWHLASNSRPRWSLPSLRYQVAGPATSSLWQWCQCTYSSFNVTFTLKFISFLFTISSSWPWTWWQKSTKKIEITNNQNKRIGFYINNEPSSLNSSYFNCLELLWFTDLLHFAAVHSFLKICK